MAEKFVLHVGFHKTGTTAIQTSMYEAQAELAKKNITYLYARARAHHVAAWSLSQRMWGWKDGAAPKPHQSTGRNLPSRLIVCQAQ